ncbi:MAG: glycoside hydrolase family 130 protein [Clostridiales bacterium]|jgi:beta-1,4-mannooligosaccharide/beta-1,4-mannosyl-N-acetylglucosamine phosphorylase|nr:glycoside hydrolase family 130 protein [Clostridiales bacterium]MDR2749895.1 glycoside hydrolase family 130 protein [Clostridiales bacterium]
MGFKILGNELKNIPWEDKPSDCKRHVWRYQANPIIKRDAIPTSNSIFNSAVVPFQGKFAGVFRCDNLSREMNIHAGFSDDGINWNIDHEPIHLGGGLEKEIPFQYAYDPRVCFIDGTYYVQWCNGYHGPTIGLCKTDDFKTFTLLENAFLPFNRNAALFPRKINGKYLMLSRPSDGGHTAFGDIFCSESPDLVYWGRHRHVMSRAGGWMSTKIGAGPIPIETDQGWLLFYHGVLNSCNGFVYAFGAALLDLDEPWKVLKRPSNYLLQPSEIYECVGDVPNVAFPCATVIDAPTGRIAIYYGCADTVTGLCFTTAEELAKYFEES